MSVCCSVPLMAVWFGNFYCPAYDDRDFIDRSMEEIKNLGFTCVELDSKDWEDFRQRFQGGEVSQYVAQQEYQMASARQHGLTYMFLALYLNGDNLYPHIRFSPPVYGESVTNPDGTDGRWYRYWSEKARDTQTEHVRDLLRAYPEGLAEIKVGQERRIPICSMWDPVAAPSFDEDGRERYTAWLKKRYTDIDDLNRAYGLSLSSFEDLTPQDWWFSLRFPDRTCYTLKDLTDDTPAFRIWADNMLWRRDELTDYFRAMEQRLHSLCPELYLMPNLSQWGHYINVDTSVKTDVGLCSLWDTANRGIDMRAISPYLDMAHFYALPAGCDCGPEPFAVSCQHAHIRSLNPGRAFLGGIYWGRFLYNDIYRAITPEEILGSIVGSGACGVMAYGWCGMDDGGLLHRMDKGFLDSLRRGNLWARDVIPRLDRRKKSRVAILFPSAMALLEPLTVEGDAERRTDFLGMYQACREYGYDPEIVEAEDLKAGFDADILLIPADRCRHALRDEAAEEALRQYVRRGGTVLHGPDADPVTLAFDLKAEKTEGTCFTYLGEGGLPSGHDFVSWPGEGLAIWREDGKNCISRTAYGNGAIYSFGFMPGYPQACRTAPHVPYSQGNRELYPVQMMQNMPLKQILEACAGKDVPEQLQKMDLKDMECACFENGCVVVSHRSTPVTLPLAGAWHGTQESLPGVLPGHSAVFIEYSNSCT